MDNFIGWDVSFNDNDPMPINNQYDHGTNVAGWSLLLQIMELVLLQ